MPNFDHCCQPTLPYSAQRSSSWWEKLALTPWGT
jgi:hypothetical protein